MQAVADTIPQLVQGMRSSQAQPEELGAQLVLIMASQNFLQVCFLPPIKLYYYMQTQNALLVLIQLFMMSFCCHIPAGK